MTTGDGGHRGPNPEGGRTTPPHSVAKERAKLAALRRRAPARAQDPLAEALIRDVYGQMPHGLEPRVQEVFIELMADPSAIDAYTGGTPAADWVLKLALAKSNPDRGRERPWDNEWIERLADTPPPDPAAEKRRRNCCEGAASLALERIVKEMLDTTRALGQHGPTQDMEALQLKLARKTAPPTLYEVAIRVSPWFSRLPRLADDDLKHSKMAASRGRSRLSRAAPEFAKLLDSWSPYKKYERMPLGPESPLARQRRMLGVAASVGSPPRRHRPARKQDAATLWCRCIEAWGLEGVARLEQVRPALSHFPVVESVAQIASMTGLSVAQVLAHLDEVADVLSRVWPDWRSVLGLRLGQ